MRRLVYSACLSPSLGCTMLSTTRRHFGGRRKCYSSANYKQVPAYVPPHHRGLAPSRTPHEPLRSTPALLSQQHPPHITGLYQPTIDRAHENLIRLQKTVDAAEAYILEMQAGMAAPKLSIRCIEKSIGLQRNLSDDEYAALFKGTDSHIDTKFVQVTTTLPSFSVEKAEAKLKEAEAKIKESKLEIEMAEAKIEKTKLEIEKAEAKIEKAEAKIKETKLEIEKAEAKIKETKLEIDREKEMVAKQPANVKASFISKVKALQRASQRIVSNGRNLNLLVSNKNFDTARSANSVGVPIYKVPLNRREDAKKVFDSYLDTPLDEDPRSNALLCNCGARGSGKTVLLGLNMFWFCSRFEDGCAIEVTFNDDFQDMEPITSTPKLFKVRVACLILCRLVSFQSGLFPNKFGQPEKVVRDYIYHNMSTLFPDDVGAIDVAIGIVRDVLDLATDAPVLLCVDEVVQASSIRATTYKTSNKENLSSLTKLLDDEYTRMLDTKTRRSFYLCVSVYGCVTLADFTTQSSRPLNVQPLPPVFPIESTTELAGKQELPQILHMLVENVRKSLDCSPNHLAVYRRVFDILMNTGGHPRHVQFMIKRLGNLKVNNVPFSIDSLRRQPQIPKNTEETVAYLGNLQTALDVAKGEIYKETDGVINYPVVLKTYLNNKKFQNTTIGGIPPLQFIAFGNTVEPFVLRKELGQLIEDAVSLIEWGLASYHNGLLFVPFPVMRALTSTGLPSNDPLFRLCKSLVDYAASGIENANEGTEKECLSMYTMMYYINTRGTFKLGDICRAHGITPVGTENLFEVEVECGGISTITEIDTCPGTVEKKGVLRPYSVKADSSDDEMAKVLRSPGIIHPSSRGNVTADYLISLRRRDGKGTILVFVQEKDWFRDWSYVGDSTVMCHVLAQFRWGQQFVTERMVATGKLQNSGGKRANPFPNLLQRMYEAGKNDPAQAVYPVFVLSTANPIACKNGKFKHNTTFGPNNTTCDVYMQHLDTTPDDAKQDTLRPNEGLMDFDHMKTWFPTVGYNASAIHKLRACCELQVPCPASTTN